MYPGPGTTGCAYMGSTGGAIATETNTDANVETGAHSRAQAIRAALRRTLRRDLLFILDPRSLQLPDNEDLGGPVDLRSMSATLQLEVDVLQHLLTIRPRHDR